MPAKASGKRNGRAESGKKVEAQGPGRTGAGREPELMPIEIPRGSDYARKLTELQQDFGLSSSDLAFARAQAAGKNQEESYLISHPNYAGKPSSLRQLGSRLSQKPGIAECETVYNQILRETEANGYLPSPSEILAKMAALADDAEKDSDRIRALAYLGDHYGLWDAPKKNDDADELGCVLLAPVDPEPVPPGGDAE